MRVFEEEEKPAYDRWFHSEFGAELTELREMEKELADHEFVHRQLQVCERWYPDKLPEVCKELIDCLEKGTLHSYVPPQMEEDEEDEEFDDEDDFDDDDDFDDEELDDIEEAFRKAFDEMFGEDSEHFDEFGEDGHADRRDRRPNPSASLSPEEANIKSLYRTLAKRLHPDHSDLESPLRERRWHELQNAYDERDLESLQRIEAVCDMEVGGLSMKLGLDRLRDLIAYHRSHVEPIRQALRKIKRDPAFDFKNSKSNAIRAEARGKLAENHWELTCQLQTLRSWINETVHYIRSTENNLTRNTVQWPKYASSRTNPAETIERKSDKDIWESHNAWREEELRRKAEEQ